MPTTDWSAYTTWRDNPGSKLTTAGGVPQIDPGVFGKPNVPGGWGGQARETKSDAFDTQFQNLLSTGTDYANYLTQTETNRYNQSNATLAQGAAAFNKPSMTDLDIRRMYSGKSDEAARAFSQNIGQLQGQLGASGVGGDSGMAMGIARNYQAQRAASLTDATRSLYEKRIDSDMHDRMDKWLATQAVAAGQARDPSIVGLDWLGEAGTAMLSKYGMDTEASAQKHAEADARSAGQMNFWGGLAKGAIGAVA